MTNAFAARSASTAASAAASERGPAAPLLLYVDHHVDDFLRHRLELAASLKRLGFDVHVAVPNEPRMDEIARSGFPVHPYYLRRLSANALDEARSISSLVTLYRRLRPSFVQHVGVKPALYGGVAARLSDVPAVMTCFTGLGYLFNAEPLSARLLRVLATKGLRFSFNHPNHRVILQNENDRRVLLSSGIVTEEQTVVIRGSGVDLSRFAYQPEHADPPVALMAARLLWDKGVGEFVEAARGLRRRNLNVRFVLAGEPDAGHPTAIPKATLQDWHASRDIEWLGWYDDMPNLLARSHIVCLPSYYGEGIPRILLEASACGRAIVTADSPGCRDIVRSGQNGLLVAARDHESLAAAVARLVENPALRARMGRQGREIAAAEHSLTQVIAAYTSVCASLVSSSRTAHRTTVTQMLN
jgi:glycosyltransferase involved in cell wall biosynthesis